MHLAHVRMGQAAQLQVDDDQAAQLAMEEQQIDPIPGLVDAQRRCRPTKVKPSPSSSRKSSSRWIKAASRSIPNTRP
jgi:hypothetical protein